jgi:Asp/Glu/hydantoin racemase
VASESTYIRKLIEADTLNHLLVLVDPLTMEDIQSLYPKIGSSAAPHKILYINPNSSSSMTEEAATYFSDKIAPDVRVDFYTAPAGAPASIDGTLDGVMSTAAVLQDLNLSSHDAEERRSTIPYLYKAVIVGCFSAHPLLPALQEALTSQSPAPPVIGIMEAAIYTALQLAPAFGIVTTGRSESSFWLI